MCGSLRREKERTGGSVAKWFKVEKTEKGLADFLDCNWSFHDFRLESVRYNARDSIADVYLEYDTHKEGVLLRFFGIVCLDIRPDEYYSSDYISASGAFLTENGTVTWIIESDDLELDSEEIRDLAGKYSGWIEAKEIHWAVTDAEGNPVEMPADRIDQTWVEYGVTSHHHFDLIPVDHEE